MPRWRTLSHPFRKFQSKHMAAASEQLLLQISLYREVFPYPLYVKVYPTYLCISNVILFLGIPPVRARELDAALSSPPATLKKHILWLFFSTSSTA